MHGYEGKETARQTRNNPNRITKYKNGNADGKFMIDNMGGEDRVEKWVFLQLR